MLSLQERRAINSANSLQQKLGFWTKRREQILRERWGDGVIAADIAAEVGCTRRAVIGKARRLKLGPAAPDRKRLGERCSEGVRRSWANPESRAKRIAGINKPSAKTAQSQKRAAWWRQKKAAAAALSTLDRVSHETSGAAT